MNQYARETERIAEHAKRIKQIRAELKRELDAITDTEEPRYTDPEFDVPCLGVIDLGPSS